MNAEGESDALVETVASVVRRQKRRVRLFPDSRSSWSAEIVDVDEIFAEEQIKRPIQGHTDLFLQTRQLAQINRAPQKPGKEAREVNPKNVRYTRPPANGCEQTQTGK